MLLQDDLIWAASWLYKATKEANYWNYVKEYIHYLEFPISVLKQEERFVGGSIMEFGWDTNHAGINVLVSQVSKTPAFYFLLIFLAIVLFYFNLIMLQLFKIFV